MQFVLLDLKQKYLNIYSNNYNNQLMLYLLFFSLMILTWELFHMCQLAITIRARFINVAYREAICAAQAWCTRGVIRTMRIRVVAPSSGPYCSLPHDRHSGS